MTWNFTLAQVPRVAAELVQLLQKPSVVALYGEMGAGKTTLVHAICKALGVADAVGSPTFSIINEYEANGAAVFHIDCYRLKSEAEAIDAGVEECLYSAQWCFVEWPEKIPHLLPADAVLLQLRLTDATTRSLHLEIKL
jgi:tRNA threonylcarbamoyladenosine biosynthesis protein TsaE